MSSLYQGNRILIIEDLEEELEKCMRFAASLGLDVRGTRLASEALQYLSSEGFDFLLTDINLDLHDPASSGPLTGFDMIKSALETQPNIVAIAMSADPNQDTNQKVLLAGGSHFFRKPLQTPDELTVYLDLATKKNNIHLQAKKKHAAPTHVSEMGEKVLKTYPNGIIVSDFHQKVITAIARNRKISSILFGETGTGKEEFAKLIHKKRMQHEGAIPFVAVNCAELNSEIASSLLFGHKKGAFSGADATTNGFVAEANGGILFLDEVHTLNLGIQRKLLRVLNDGSYYRIGDTRAAHSFFQSISATTADLDDEVEAGRFLPDLRNRLTGVDVHLEPLRNRLTELPLIIASFFYRKGVNLNETLFNQIVERCRHCTWKGNIRQLYKMLEAMLIMAEVYDEPLSLRHLQIPGEKPGANPIPPPPAPQEWIEPKPAHAVQEVTPEISTNREQNPVVTLLERALVQDQPLSDLMDAIEKEVLVKAIARHKTLSEIHDALQISRSAMDGKRKKYKI